MKIGREYKIREIAGEHVVIAQGRYGADMTRVISLNDSAVYLWNALSEEEFTAEDAARLLTERYEVDEATAARDAADWIARLGECGVVIR